MIAELEVVNHQGDRVFHQNRSACQYRSENDQADDTLERRGTAVVLPESIQEANCPPHIQSPACRCHVTTRSRILWPIRPATESESRIGPINRALTRARCELAAGEVVEVGPAPSRRFPTASPALLTAPLLPLVLEMDPVAGGDRGTAAPSRSICGYRIEQVMKLWI